VVALGAVAGGCGSTDLDGAALSQDIEDGLKRQNKVRTVTVKCPAKIERKAQGRFSCTFVSDRAVGVIRVVQQDDQGSVRWQVDPKSVHPI
jgi:hypothetical protein